MQRLREREVTFAVKRSWPLPDLGGLAAGRLEESTDELRAVYYDTEHATLQRLGVTLRRRTGGRDAGWHLKIAADPARTELQSRARGERPPVALVKRLAGVLNGTELREVATITTTRRALRLLDEQGVLLAEVADDQVSGTTGGEAPRLDRWREVEVELGPAGDEDLLARIAKVFRKAGARPAEVQRKLDRLSGPFPVVRDGGRTGRAVAAYVQDQAVAILLGDVALRDQPQPETIHRTRVAIRRLRSTLRTFGAALALDEEARTRLDDDLRWLAGLLGPIRDHDILARRLVAEIAALPTERVLGPVEREVTESLAAERSAAVAAWRKAWNDERYRALMATLTGWLVTVPLAEGRVDGAAVLKRARRTADRRLARAGDDLDALHAARKAAKRLRYAGELLTDVLPKAAQVAERAKQRQTVLGDHQDLVVAADFLLRAGAQAGTRPGHNGFTYGLLLARVEQQAADIRRRL